MTNGFSACWHCFTLSTMTPQVIQKANVEIIYNTISKAMQIDSPVCVAYPVLTVFGFAI